MRSQTLLFLVPVALATSPRIRPAVPKGFGGQSTPVDSLAFSSCDIGYVTCENACMPSDGVCCGDGTDEYCYEGYYCVPNACCPEGETCSGSGVGDAECAIGETECGDLCMPLDGTCCSDGLHYCPDFGTCTEDGYCCDIGDDCNGSSSSGGGGGGGIFSSDLPTSTDDDFTFTTPAPTTTRDDDSPFTTATASRTSSDDEETTTTTRSTSSRSSTTSSTTTATTDSQITDAPTNPISQQAGGHFTADGKMAAGLAIAAAILI